MKHFYKKSLIVPRYVNFDAVHTDSRFQEQYVLSVGLQVAFLVHDRLYFYIIFTSGNSGQVPAKLFTIEQACNKIRLFKALGRAFAKTNLTVKQEKNQRICTLTNILKSPFVLSFGKIFEIFCSKPSTWWFYMIFDSGKQIFIAAKPLIMSGWC
jgi:hypothetical protein